MSASVIIPNGERERESERERERERDESIDGRQKRSEKSPRLKINTVCQSLICYYLQAPLSSVKLNKNNPVGYFLGENRENS